MILPWNELGSFSGAFLIFTVEFFVKSMFCILLMLAIEHLIWRKRPLLADICWRGMLLFMIMLPAVILLLPEMRLLPDPGFSESFRKTAFLQERQLTPRFSESGLPTETVLREMSVQISPLMSTERQSVPERKSIRSNTLSMGTLLSITSLVAFCLGGFFFLVRLLLSWRALKNIHTKAKVDLSEIYDLMNSLKTEMGIRQEIRLLYSSEISVPMTYGFWNPCILIPTSLKDTDDQKTITAVLIHELVHIARADFKYQLMIKLIRCCYWWHPGFWWMQRRIETLAELICDGYTAGQMQSRQEYVDVLLNQAGRLVHGTPPSCTLAMASFRLKQRLQALALIKVNQFTETPVRYGVGLLFFFVIALICGTLGWTSSNISQSYAESTLIDGNQRTIKRFRELEYNSLGNKLQKSVILPQGTLSGRVVNAEGRPLSGVLVDACTWCKGTETYTDESGGFLLTGFEVGSKVQVQFSHTKYASHLVESQPVDRQNWEVALNTDSSLSGKVLSPDGKPVPGAKVNVVRVSFSPMFNENVEVVETVETDETGSYKLLLEPARYELRVRVPEVGGYRLQGLIIREQENRTFDIKLAKQARFQARLIDVITEKPVPGVRLESQQLK
ncbi:MAG: carboxypeptidase regulatory-like domain-containing protein, partial [Planctomycetaceae bacterium]|nr:carboxypeptidase regulatory-like domain-containing protein [Planctomycetaceae bacterium]